MAERKHRHLLEVARAFRFQAIHHYLFGVNVLTATFLINRFPTPVLSGKTPHEVLLSSAPSYEHLRAFGCLCYAHTHSLPKNKFAPRATRSVFVGYPYGQRGYRVYDLHTK